MLDRGGPGDGFYGPDDDVAGGQGREVWPEPDELAGKRFEDGLCFVD